jgi:cathepsin A (carboxypeptidase C)
MSLIKIINAMKLATTILLSTLVSMTMSLPILNVDQMSFPSTPISELPFNSFFPEPELHGLIPIMNNDDMFYWLFPSRNDPDKDPLVIWLSGGPGCSSSLAIFHENGPMSLKDGEPVIDEISWNNRANLVFVDQPIGTGFSGGTLEDMPKFEKEVARQFEIFLLGFYEKYPHFKGRDLYITGESYAGHYIPFISARVIESQDSINAGINLVGVGIGNGWVAPASQVLGYAPFAYQNKLINVVGETALQTGFRFCRILMEYNIPYFNILVCNYLTQSVLGSPLNPRFNVYDIRRKCDVPPLCYDFSDMETYLNREDVQAALGVGGRKWESCNMEVHTAMLMDWGTNAAPNVAKLLAAGKKVLIYNGDKDYICNWVGGEVWVKEMDWEHKEEFNAVDYEDIGYAHVMRLKNFEFMRVLDAGHMVPMDQPDAALKMLDRLVYDWDN